MDRNDSTPERTPTRKKVLANDALIALEKLDRSSPDLWPEKSFNDFISSNSTPISSSPPTWTKGLTTEDINIMHRLGALSNSGIAAEIRKLYNEAYHLGLVETKEMNRASLLGIFVNTKRK